MKRSTTYKKSLNSQKGFTIIELITAGLTISVLAGLAIQTFGNVKSQALYAVVSQTIGYANKASTAALADSDSVYPDLNYTQTTQGVLTDTNAKNLLPGFTLSQNVKIYLNFDSTCQDDSCVSLSITARHCQGKNFSTFSKNGYGEEVTVDRIPGEGCP